MSRVQQMIGVATTIATTKEELKELATSTVRKGTAVFNTDSKELYVASTDGPISELTDHKHPNTHAPIIHSHMWGANEPWLASNPRLWYRPDVENHPELIPLDGSDIPKEKAEFLSGIYDGTVLLTDKLTSSDGIHFENNEVILTVNSFFPPYGPYAIANGPVEIHNVADTTDQFLAKSSEVVMEYSFKYTTPVTPSSYFIMPAAGTSTEIMKTRPAPKSWKFEGFANDEWVVIDQHEEETGDLWQPFHAREFLLEDLGGYTKFRLTISDWHPGETDDGLFGIRRFIIFGNREGTFALPNLDVPNADFVWVVPYKNLNVGLAHESVGDIGYTSLMTTNLPAYRLPADGRFITKVDYPLLFSSIGYMNDVPMELPDASGSEIEGQYVITASFTRKEMLGRLFIDFNEHKYPTGIIVEGKVSDSEYIKILEIQDMQLSIGSFLIHIDTTIEDAPLIGIRVTITGWAESESEIGFVSIKAYTHPVGKFRIPEITYDKTGGVTPYIVSDNTASDVSAEIISRLQVSLASLASSVASLQNQVNAIDPSIQPSEE